MKNSPKLFFLLLFVVANSLMGQQETNVEETPINTDRPTQTYSAFVVPKGVFQIESGFGYSQIKQAGFGQDFFIESIALNSLQLRYGISKNVELRLFQNISYNRFGPKGDKLRSDLLFAPTSIGTKIRIVDEEGFRPQISFLAEFGGEVFSDLGNENIKIFRLNFSNTISSKFSIAYSLGMNFGTDFSNSNTSITLLGAYTLSPKISVFGEYYSTLNPDFFNLHNYDFGVTYLVNNNLQLDVYAGSYFKKQINSTDLIFGFGFSTRIFKK
uniref:transporter n=1 Tax=Roseivirga sp. TaxID=1964215 RepID=UPI004047DA34